MTYEVQSAVEGYRLSPAQAAVWDKQQPHTWWVRGVIRIQGRLDRARLENALSCVEERNDVLRTVLARLPGMRSPLQLDGGSVRRPLAIENGRVFDLDTSAGLEALLQAPAPELAWERGPLWHALLVSVSEQEHALVASFPALLADPLSLPLFVEHLARAYAGDDDEDEALAFLEYSEWHRELIESEERSEGIEFWRRSGRNGQPHAEGAATAPHSVVQWDEGLAADPGGENLPIKMLTAVVVLASRLFNQNRPTVFARLGNRKFTEFAKSLGPFNALLPLQVDCAGEMSFADVEANVRKALEEAGHWDEFWFCPEVQKDASRWPTADLAFEYLDAQRIAVDGDLHFELAAVRSSAPEQCGTRYSFLRRPSGFTVDMAPSPPTCADAGRRYLEHFQELLGDALENPTRSVSRLRLLNDRWRRTIQVDWNPREPAGAIPSLAVHELFEQQVKLTPDAIAVTLQEERLTFRELNGRANRLARWLAARGIGPEVPCAILLDRGPDMIAAILAIWKCGGCYVPCDPTLPDSRFEFMLQQAQVRLVVTQSQYAARVSAGTTRDVCCMDEDSPGLERLACGDLQRESDWDNLAYIVFTSGSTGHPKAVSVSHRSVVHLWDSLARTVYAEAARGDCVGLNAPLTFDASIKQILQITRGCTLAIIPDEIRRDVGQLVDYLNRQRVDILDLTPSHLRLLLTDEAAWNALRVRRFLLGGEQLDPATALRITSGSCAVPRSAANVYGPTECTDVATTCELVDGEAITIGRPLPHVRVYVLDGWGNLVPPGVTGEIYLGGPGVARGYYRQPALTAERFLPDPFAADEGARLYRTGDVGRFLSDGRLVFVGRNDRQVKLNGFRVELGEIEATLLRHPNVKAAAVVATNEADGQKQVNAYAVPRVPGLRGEGLLELPNGMRVAHQNKNETAYLFEEIFEKRSYTKNGIQLHDDMCVFDVGANVGMFSLYVMAVCPTAQITAFEPIGPIYDTLRRNVERFDRQVKTKPFGLASTTRQETFTYYPRYSMMSGASQWSRPDDESEVVKQFLANEARNGGASESSVLLEHATELLSGRFDGKEVTCRLRTLSDVIDDEGVSSIDLLKIDVQRAELDVLEGLRDEHWARIRQIAMEVHDAAGTESEGRTDQIEKLLQGHGFEVVIEQDELLVDTDRYNLYAVRPAVPPGLQIRNADGIPTTDLSAEQLRSFLGQELPAYMQPANIILMDELPVNAHGKVAHGELPAPESLRNRDRTGPPEYTNQQEATLAAIWSEVLHADEVWPDDNFFELGGDSIRSIQVQIAAKQRGITFTLPQFFEHQTIRQLAASLSGSPTSAPGASAVTAPFALLAEVDRAAMPSGVEDAFPMAALSRGMHYHTQLRGSNATYHTFIGNDIHCELDKQRFLQAADELAAAHPVFRSAFDFGGYSQPLQLVFREIPQKLVSVYDLRHLNAERQTAHIREFIEASRQKPMDLTVPALLHIHLFDRDDSLSTLIWEDYHGIIDGLSAHLALVELLQRYQLLLGKSQQQLPEQPSATFADFIAAEQLAMQDPAATGYWTEKYRDVPIQKIPRQKFAAPQPRDMESVSVTIPADVVEQLQAQAKSNALPLKSLLLAVHLRVMGLIQQTAEPVTGLVTNVRPECVDGDRVLGLFINTLPCQLRLGSDSWLELARRCYELEREQLPFRRVPLAEICRRLRRPALFETFFNYAHFHSQTQQDEAGLRDGRWDRTVDIDFTLSVDFEVQHDNSILLQLIYDNHELSRAQVERFAKYVSRGVRSFADDPGAYGQEFLAGGSPCEPDSPPAVKQDLDSGVVSVASPEKVPPSTDDRKLAALVAEVLECREEDVSMNASFEALGGHSLLIAVLCERIHASFGVSLCPRNFIGHPTLAELAARIVQPELLLPGASRA